MPALAAREVVVEALQRLSLLSFNVQSLSEHAELAAAVPLQQRRHMQKRSGGRRMPVPGKATLLQQQFHKLRADIVAVQESKGCRQGMWFTEHWVVLAAAAEGNIGGVQLWFNRSTFASEAVAVLSTACRHMFVTVASVPPIDVLVLYAPPSWVRGC